jgi:2-polyprenyl-3-methyl-5-hydroxy-6-metoxy-1,4-benzoquinol methylase
MALDDPELVAREYADDARLRKRASAYTGVTTGLDAREPALAAIRSAAPERVLEVGCGWGELAEWIARDTGAEVVAIDLSERMVQLARERGIDARVADVQELPFADGAFDVVVAAWMLYHVPDLDAGLGEIARVLTKGGALIAVTNSEQHIAELRDLLAYPPGAFEMSFNSENGEEHLRRHFASVERFDTVARATVREREKLVAYRNSVSVPTQPVPEDVELPFIVHGRTSIFVAMT